VPAEPSNNNGTSNVNIFTHKVKVNSNWIFLLFSGRC
jgi:hypothetical protein